MREISVNIFDSIHTYSSENVSIDKSTTDVFCPDNSPDFLTSLNKISQVHLTLMITHIKDYVHDLK